MINYIFISSPHILPVIPFKPKTKPIPLSALFFKYYRDTIRYNLGFSLLCAVLANGNLIECLIIFGTIGGFVSFWVYQYYQNIEYYFYRNGGITKRRLQIKTLLINLIIAALILIILWIIKLL